MATGPGGESRRASGLRYLGSRLLSVHALFLGALLIAGVATPGDPEVPTQDAIEEFRCTAAREWRALHPGRSDLQVVATEVSFRGSASDFVREEGLVVASLGQQLPQAQRVLDVRSLTKLYGRFDQGGSARVAWPYAGLLMRDMRYVAVSLVERPSDAQPLGVVPSPTFQELPRELRLEATIRVQQSPDHDLEKCRGLHAWAMRIAGEGSYLEQLERMAKSLSWLTSAGPGERKGDDVCDAIRNGHFSRHQKMVALTIGGREIGAPTFGVNVADANDREQLATYVDGHGWVTLSIRHPEKGFQKGGPAWITRAPLIAQLEATAHEHWRSEANAFEFNAYRGGASTISRTTHADQKGDHEDITRTTSQPLAKVCTP